MSYIYSSRHHFKCDCLQNKDNACSRSGKNDSHRKQKYYHPRGGHRNNNWHRQWNMTGQIARMTSITSSTTFIVKNICMRPPERYIDFWRSHCPNAQNKIITTLTDSAAWLPSGWQTKIRQWAGQYIYTPEHSHSWDGSQSPPMEWTRPPARRVTPRCAYNLSFLMLKSVFTSTRNLTREEIQSSTIYNRTSTTFI